MKKIISLIILSFFVCSLCGCNNADRIETSSTEATTETVTSNITHSEISSDTTSSAIASSEEGTSISSTSSEAKDSSKVNQNTSSVSSKANSSGTKSNISSKNGNSSNAESKNVSSEKNSFALGTVKGNKYINRFAKISCELGSDWVFLNDEQIRENNKTALGLIDENYAEQIKNADVFTDMFATNVNQTDTINITFEKLSGVALNFTEQEYLSKSKASVKNALKSMGFEDVFLVIGKANFAGVKRYYHAVSATYNGVPVYERIVTVKCENYMAVIVACTWQTNTCKEIFDSFKAIK